jgi:hypothetical protein
MVSESSHNRLPKRLRWAGRIIGLLASVGWLAVMTASSAYDLAEGTWEEMSTQDIVQGALIAVIAAVALAGCIVSWWRLRLATILLVLASVAIGIHVALVAGRNHFLAWSFSGLPYLIAGALFFGSWRLSRRA